MPAKQRKVIVLGARSVGKSSLTIQFVEQTFVDNYNPTIENTFEKKVVWRREEYQLAVVDTAGQDEYSLMPEKYTIDSHGFMLVFAINDRTSFDVVKIIYAKLLDLLGQMRPGVLIGNKKDLDSNREVPSSEAQSLANSWKIPYYEVSAKHYQSVKEAFDGFMTELEKQEGNPPSRPCSIS